MRRPLAGLSFAGLLVAVAIFALPLASPAQSPNPWARTWNTTYAEMTLTQSGNSVEGTYGFQGGHISGTVSGNVLTGRWDEEPTRAGPNDAGPLQFTLAPDEQSFTGTWRYDGDDPSISRGWNGTAAGAPPPPVLGKAVSASVVSGEVLIAVPAAGSAGASQKGVRFVPLTADRQVPVGSVLDTRKGTVRVVSARNSAGATQAGQFSAGVFQVLQSRARRTRGLTELRLKGSSFARCRRRQRGRGAAQLGRAHDPPRCARTPAGASAPAGATPPPPSAAPLDDHRPLRRHAHHRRTRQRRRPRLPPQEDDHRHGGQELPREGQIKRG